MKCPRCKISMRSDIEESKYMCENVDCKQKDIEWCSDLNSCKEVLY